MIPRLVLIAVSALLASACQSPEPPTPAPAAPAQAQEKPETPSVPAPAPVSDRQKAFEEAQRIYDLQLRTDELKAYENAWTEYHNAHHPHDGDECFLKQGNEFVLIQKIDAEGKVSDVYVGEDSPRAQCLQAAFKLDYPKPPIAPYYRRLTMYAGPPPSQP
jgi:hypothetical protein